MTEKEQAQHLREQLKTGERGGSDTDRDALLEFSDRLKRMREEYTWHRHLKLLRHSTIASEQAPVDLVDAREDPDACQQLVDWIHDKYDIDETPYTNQDYRVAVRIFGKRTLGHDLAVEQREKEDVIPPVMKREIKTTLPRSFKPRPDPAKMLWWDDHIDPMLQKCRYSRDAAMIAVSWDLGARSGEMRELRVGDVTDHKYGLQVSLDGKTGQRSPTVINAVPYLNRWLADHPKGTDPTAPLWCDLDSGRDVSYKMKLKMMKKPARRAEIKHTDITWRRMRKSSASFLASQNVSQAHLEDHHGWERGSDVASHYVAVFGDANDRAVAKAHGMDVQEDDPEPTAPVNCPRCERETPRERPDCMWCGQPLSHESVRQKKNQTMELLDAIQTEDGDAASALVELGKILEEYPALNNVVGDDIEVKELYSQIQA
ncbi:integrase [Haloferax sp. Atlit-4N]|uniref:site-specific integrase n=1 Tax=Haloferax sp. Atlit-4N TaxID=2077206 RepID=UPI000E23D881|nr:site-specific integrase [Haloferax sp. Atlit-4N]RDZ53089.1 integrase [Haloferax sp. Atlit-4N]